MWGKESNFSTTGAWIFSDLLFPTGIFNFKAEIHEV